MTAHPRVCGENWFTIWKTGRPVGSSPRVRGKRARGRGITRRRRLIPACAGKTPGRPCTRPCGWAHPRVCGENPNPATFTWTCGGSSPRLRGKPSWGSTAAPSSRLIPACAGKTWPTAPPSWFRRAHPRVCGENTHASSCACAIFGSSPRVRGKRPPRPSGTRRRRLIPACAGKTRPWAHADLRQEAHPRVCGENPAVPASSATHRGSSPRVRGKPTCRGCPGRPPRLIPARAGKTAGFLLRPLLLRAHPRACGENPARCRGGSRTEGSSPRVRGKRPGWPSQPGHFRLIPARAGKTWVTAWPTPSPRAHPRVCGENDARRSAFDSARGSSPRVRGKLAEHVEGGLLDGLIPACAGKTGASRRCGSRARAHPRVCGENYGVEIELFDGYGSSPRVRGKPTSWRRAVVWTRLIPACAGKTP